MKSIKYKIIKIDVETNQEYNYGEYDELDMKQIIKGYKFNGLFYSRKGSKYFYIVEEVK